MNFNEQKQKKLFTRRSVILGSCKIALVGLLIGKMFHLQILGHKKFSELSERNRVKTKLIPPLRGRILDRNNKALALNEQNYQLVFEKLETRTEKDDYKVLMMVIEILKLSQDQAKEIIDQAKEMEIDDELIVMSNLSWSQVMDIELNIYYLPGVYVKLGFSRLYPYEDLFAHLTGYIGTISNKDKLKNSIHTYPLLKVGKNGIEKTQEGLLCGMTGSRKIEVNAKGEEIREISISNSISGRNIQLTIDADLQQKASNLLSNNTGVVLVAKIKTGEILVSVSKPSFNPNLFNQAISTDEWNKLINNEDLPMIDRTVALTYPPGSIFKINVAIAALKQNFNPETKFFCPGYYTLGERKFKCWNKFGHGSINLHEAIAGSCNVYLWHVARIIGIQPFADIAKLLGYNQKLLNGELPREQNGIIPDPEWKKNKIGTKWTLADTINSAIGQGYVDATSIQILTMISRIASGKKFIPNIIKSDNSNRIFESIGLDREIAIVKKGMEMAVNNPLGTAYSNRIIEKELSMAGKTGTCQVISKRYEDDDLSKANVVKKIKNHGMFVAYAPIHNPEYSFCGIIEHGGSSSLAVKIAKELLQETQLRKI